MPRPQYLQTVRDILLATSRTCFGITFSHSSSICFTSRIQRPVIVRLPIMYCRYIVDFCVVTISYNSSVRNGWAVQRFQHTITVHKVHKFRRESWLSFLSTRITVTSGQYSVQRYRKESSKNVIIHTRSAHPSAVKPAVLHKVFRTAVRCVRETRSANIHVW